MVESLAYVTSVQPSIERAPENVEHSNRESSITHETACVPCLHTRIEERYDERPVCLLNPFKAKLQSRFRDKLLRI